MAYPFYNNPYGYQQPMYDQLQQLRSQSQQPMIQQIGTVDDRIFVQGEIAAQAYLVAPNSFVRLWDSQSNVFYEKRADSSGRPYMETYEYKKRDNLASHPVTESNNTIDYELKINALEKRIRALESRKGVVQYVAESNDDDTEIQ